MAPDDGLNSGSQNLPRSSGRQRRLQRSCDLCRQRKIRCDGSNTSDGCCSNCLAFGAVCTYLEPPRTRGRKVITVEQLKNEIASLKAKLQSLSVCSLCAQPLQFQSQGDVPFKGHSSPECDTTSMEPLEDEDFDELASDFSGLNMQSPKPKYLGSASSFALVNSAIIMKEKCLGQTALIQPRRPLFWDMLPWEKNVYNAQLDYAYPPSDLITSLLGLYFANIHPTIPILHRPSFERSVAEGLHLKDMDFGGTLLSALALASRYSKDPRVFINDDPSLLLSAGWKFASQVWILRKLPSPTIYEVQMYCLLSHFALGTSAPQTGWLYIGLGIRFIQQRGEHRRKREGYELDAEDELWKRAFWSFVSLERIACLFLGRPVIGVHPEDYDVELPLEVDDEYWDSGFIQPPGKPSQLSYFACHLRLCEILGDVMRRLYGSKKSKILMGWDGPDWERRAIATLDSAMNDFVDTIPPHLRWDPENPPQGTFFDQSAFLHVIYNHVLIAIHRPYILRVTTLGAPSLSICARAARAILHTVHIWLRKLQRVPLPSFLNSVFVSGVILVLYAMTTKRNGLPMEKNKDLVQVATALEILKFTESRSQPVGRLWDLLQELYSLDGHLSLKDLLNDDLSSGDAGASRIRTGECVFTKSLKNSGSSLPARLDEYNPQLGQSFDGWNTAPSSDQLPEFEPGMSIEQLLADSANAMDSILDDELMSMWMAAPTDMTNIGNWNAYIENMNGVDANWSNSFGAQQ